MLAALFVAYIVSFVDRMIVGLLVEGIKADLKISDTQISLIQGAAFALFFTIAAIPLGRIIDRVHRPRAVAVGIALWSAMTVACGMMTSFVGLFVARMGVGVGEAVLSPAAYSIISDSFSKRRLGVAMGIFGLGSAIGAGLALMIGGVVMSAVSSTDSATLPLFGEVRPWQFAFIVAGLPGFLIALLFLFIPDPRHALGGPPPVVPIKAVTRHLSTNAGFFWSVFMGVAAINLSVLGTVSWLPVLLIRGHAFGLSDAGYLSGGALIVGGLIGMVGFGAIMDRLGGEPRSRMLFCGWSTAVAAIAGLAFPLVGSPLLLAILFTAFFSAAAGVVSAAPSVIQQRSPPGMRATIASVYVFVINLIGLGLGPSVTAGLGDWLFPGGDGIRYAMAMVAPGGYVVGAILFFVAARYARKV